MQQALLHLIFWALSRLSILATQLIEAWLYLTQSQRWSRAIKLALVGLFTTLLIVACGDNTPNQATIGGATSSKCQIVKHDLGETKVCGQPQKIAVFGPYMLDLLLSLDMQPAAYADVFAFYQGEYFNHPSQQIPYLGSRVISKPLNLGLRDAPSLEALSQLKPDLILSEAGGVENIYPLLSKIAPTLLFEDRIVKNRWQQSIQAIAQALGRSKLVPKVIAAHNQRLANTRAELAAVVKADPRLLLLGANQLNEIRIFDHNEYIGGLMADVGFQVVSLPNQENTAQATLVSLEVLPSLSPADTIIILGYNLDPSTHQGNVSENQLKKVKQEWSKNELAQTLPASQKNRVYFVTYYLWNGLNGPIGAELILKQFRQLL